MAPKKAKVPTSWNAKPVTRAGGASGGVRKPSKPYAKPPAKPTEKPARLTTKAPAKPPAKPAVTLPNSAKAGVNLPKVGAGVMRQGNQGPDLRGTRPGGRGATPPPAAPAKPKAMATNAGRAAGGLRGAGRVLGPVAVAADLYTTGRSVFNPNDNIVTRLGKLGNSIERAVGSGGGAGMQPQAQNLSGGRYVPGDRQNYRTNPAKPPTQPKTQPSTRNSNNGGGGSSAPRSSGGVSSAPSRGSAASLRIQSQPSFTKQTGDKEKDMATWRKANPTLAKALDDRESAKRARKAVNEGRATAAEYNVSESEGKRRLGAAQAKANMESMSPAEQRRVRRRYS